MQNVDIKEKMEEIVEIEEQNEEILKFRKAHKGDLDKKRKQIDDFKSL